MEAGVTMATMRSQSSPSVSVAALALALGLALGLALTSGLGRGLWAWAGAWPLGLASGLGLGPWAWALAAEGQAGLTRLLNTWQQELKLAMTLTGVTRIADINETHLDRTNTNELTQAGEQQ